MVATRLLSGITDIELVKSIKLIQKIDTIVYVCTLADLGFFKNYLYQGGVKSTGPWVFEDLKFKISEGYNQNWCFPDSAKLN